MRDLLLLISCLILIFFIKDIVTVLIILSALSCLFYGVIDTETWNKLTNTYSIDIDIKKTNNTE